MKRLFLLTSIFFALTLSLQAQDSGVSFELHYPFAIADVQNNTTELTGLLGAAVGFQFSNMSNFNYGIKYKFDQYTYSQDRLNSIQTERKNFMMHNINGFGKYYINYSGTMEAVFEGGLTFYKYNKSNTQPSYFGFNLNPGLNYNFHENFYALVNYSYINTGLKDRQTEYVKKEQFHVFRVGIGFKL